MIFNPTENEIKLGCHDLIIENVAYMLGIEGKDNDNFYTLYCKGKEMSWEDFDTYDLTEPCECECGNVVGTMLFGDGTLEIVFKDNEEPMCWDEMSARDISKLCRQVSKEFAEFYSKKLGI